MGFPQKKKKKVCEALKPIIFPSTLAWATKLVKLFSTKEWRAVEEIALVKFVSYRSIPSYFWCVNFDWVAS